MIRICAVSYLNTKPFLEGLTDVFTENEIFVHTDIPSECARIFERGGADLALIPAGALPDFKNPLILDKYCIGANGRVDSVFICSQKPISEISRLVPDMHSRTSNRLADILLQNYWKKEPEITPPADGAWKNPNPDTAYVIIGDKAVQAREKFLYVYDLAAEWQAYTGLPFVFAVWVHNDLPQQTLNRIQLAFETGLNKLPEVAALWGPTFGLSQEAALHYYSVSLSYDLDADKKAGLKRFLSEMAVLQRR